MRRYSSNLAFVDLLFNLLVGFTSLFVIAFLLINPIAKQGVVDPPILLMVEMEWSDESLRDIDLYVKGPDGVTIYFSNKSNGYITLKRDDTGRASDTFVVNGEEVVVNRNYEVTTFTALPDGDYVVGAHYYSFAGAREEVKVSLTGLQPYEVYFEGSFDLSPKQEDTVLVFQVKDGEIVSMRTDIKVKLSHSPIGP